MADDRTRKEQRVPERDAFITRVEGIIDPAYRLATVILLDHQAAEDVVHDATLAAWSRYRALHGEVTSFRTWFLSIVAARSRRRRRWRRLTLRRGDVGRRDRSAGVVGDLPLAGRVALFCRVALGLPDDEAARVLRTSPARVKSRALRARQRVEAELQRRLEDGL